MEDVFVEAWGQWLGKCQHYGSDQEAEEEPRPGFISRESFSEIAGIYVYNALYL